MKMFICGAALAIMPSLAIAKNVANNDLPFKYEVVKVDAVDRSGSVTTVVTLKIENGKNSLPSATFHCEAKSEKGNTWDVEGTAKNLDPSEVRTVRLTNAGDTTGDFSKPASVSCEVKAFDGGIR
ncbi:hypothetical protein [Agrobacterium larrymoorei]|uniref:hypothetical protein n=1 Tax=Agrobacterium larrymoorei TaxID=160699 RepID=UPI0030BC04D7